MPRNWRTTLFLATQDGLLPEVVVYPALMGNFESLSLDNTPSEPVWSKSSESSPQNMSDTRLTLMKIRQMQNREKEHIREVMEEDSLANALAAINIDSNPNYAQGSAAPVDSFPSTFEPRHDAQEFAGKILKPETRSPLGDFIPNTGSERRSSQARRSRNYHPYQYRQPSAQSEGGPSCVMEY